MLPFAVFDGQHRDPKRPTETHSDPQRPVQRTGDFAIISPNLNSLSCPLPLSLGDHCRRKGEGLEELGVVDDYKGTMSPVIAGQLHLWVHSGSDSAHKNCTSSSQIKFQHRKERGSRSTTQVRSHWWLIAVGRGKASFLSGWGPRTGDHVQQKATHPRI